MIKKKNISKEDINTWKQYIKNPTDITNKDDLEKQNNFKNKRFKFDLHGYTLKDANEKVREIVLSCSQKNYKEILLITGKGIHSNTSKDVFVSNELSKLRFSVPDFLKNNNVLKERVISIKAADKIDGGEGAIIIKLKRL